MLKLCLGGSNRQLDFVSLEHFVHIPGQCVLCFAFVPDNTQTMAGDLSDFFLLCSSCS